MITGVLFIPEPGDPTDMLSRRGLDIRTAYCHEGVWKLAPNHNGNALVLAWDGVEDAAGIARAFDVSCPSGEEKTIGLVPGKPPLRRAQHRACYAEWRGLGSWVHVDGDGKAVAGSLRLR